MNSSSKLSEAPVERRLAAILAADVVGYSRLMGADEVGTLRALRAYRREVIDPAIAARRGRIVKTTGDGLLVEFASAVDAMACAITVQQIVNRRGESMPDNKRITFRVGINVGDVIIEAGDIFGDGVNVAARLETLSEPGGICISRAVRDQVRDKLPIALADLGEQTVKNIARPVRVFALSPQSIADAPELAGSAKAGPAPSRRRWIAGAIAAIVIVAVATGAAWWVLRAPAPEMQASSSAAPAMAARASIAVLPFGSLTPEAGSDYFADGLTEDIISALGRFRELSVISRVAVLGYKGKNPTPAEIGRDFKVSYVVEGTVRRSADRIRVSVSLTDTSRGTVLWSEKFDAELKDIFSVQDQITRRISGELAVRVTNLELMAAATKPPNNMEAYDLVLRGRNQLLDLTRTGNAEARTLFERAMSLDPNYAPAYVGLARVNINSVTQGWTPDPSAALERAESLARKAIELDDLNSTAHALLGTAAVYFGDYDRGYDELKRAIALNGSDAESYGGLIHVLLWRGDFKGAIEAGEILRQVQPNLPVVDAFHLATAYILGDRGADSVRVLEQSLSRNPADRPTNIMLAVAYAAADRRQDAEKQAELVHRRYPVSGSNRFGSLLRDPAQREKLEAALKNAGL